MRKTAFVGSLFIVSTLLSGCIFVSSSKTTPQEHPKPHCVQTPPVSATIAEIDAAGKLMSPSAKANIYKAIARRPDLTTQERIHLTNAVTHLMSPSDKEEILLILVNNHPAPVQPAPKQSRTAKPPIPGTAEPPEK
ncbi:MAG: hypothetical protein ABFR90_08765 [Planctomycetota bacterium]